MIENQTMEDLLEQFASDELVTMCEFVGLAPTSEWDSQRMVTSLITYFKEKDSSALDMSDKMRELVDDFLYVAGLSDDEEEETKPVEQTLQQFMKAHDIEVLPDCWSYADSIDPACKKCLLYDYCAKARVAELPKCFGVEYNAENVECIGCIEAPFCKQKTL